MKHLSWKDFVFLSFFFWFVPLAETKLRLLGPQADAPTTGQGCLSFFNLFEMQNDELLPFRAACRMCADKMKCALTRQGGKAKSFAFPVLVRWCLSALICQQLHIPASCAMACVKHEVPSCERMKSEANTGNERLGLVDHVWEIVTQ